MTDCSCLRVRRLGLVVLCVFVGVAVAATAVSAGEPDDDELVEIDENVSVWIESTYALTLKQPDETTAMTGPLITSQPTRTITAETAGGTAIDGQPTPPAASMLDGDSLLQFDFSDERGADTEQFAGTNSSLIVAELDSPADPAVDGAAELSAVRAAELLAADNRTDRASFDTQFTDDDSRDMRVIDGGGSFASYYGLAAEDEGGLYALYHLKTADGAISATDGSLSVDGEVTVLGIETVAVHDGASTADTDAEHELGESIEFAVAADGQSVDHTVAVFNESAVADEQLTQTTDEAIDTDVNPAAITVTESAAITGVADTEPATVFGATLDDSVAHQTTDVGVLASYLSTADPDNEGPAGSITARQGVDGSEQLAVETLDSWDSGSYTYIHIATAADGTTMSTSGSLALVDPETGNDPAAESSTNSRSSSGIAAGMETNITETNGSTLLSVENADNSDTVAVEPNTTAAGTTLTDLELPLVRTVDSFDAEITGEETTPTGVPPLDSTSLSYLTIEADALSTIDYGALSVQFSVDPDRLSTVGLDESDVQLYQYNGADWDELETEQRGEHSYVASTTELSTFAIGSIEDAEEALTISNATIDTTLVEPNESVTVTATVENPTADDVGAAIDLEVDGTVEETLVETISTGESQEVQFELTPSENGSYDVSVAGTAAGTLEVAQSIEDETRDETPGFGLVAAVSALLAVVVGRRLSTH